jgi:hypothetical protein
MAAWSTYVCNVLSPPARKETGAMGREIEPRQGIRRVVAFKLKKNCSHLKILHSPNPVTLFARPGHFVSSFSLSLCNP